MSLSSIQLCTLFLLLVLSNTFIYPYLLLAKPNLPQPNSRIILLGSVYCDACCANTFTKHSYFLPGVDVNIQCKFKASPPGTTEQISFSVNRTTDAYGMYKLDIPDIDGVDCTQDPTIQSFCQSSLISSPIHTCNIKSTRSTSTEITLKSRQTNVCTYTLGALSFKPSTRNVTLCGYRKMEVPKISSNFSDSSFNSSKFFLPYFPPYFFPWPPFPPLPQLPPFPQLPPLPQLPPFPQLPPLPQLPPFPQLPPIPQLPTLPPFTSFPFPTTPTPPSFPFPTTPNPPSYQFPPFPPYTKPPSLQFPPPSPAFNLSDPRTWIPNYPFLPPPPPPSPPAFNFWDPRTWMPMFPPSPPAIKGNSMHP